MAAAFQDEDERSEASTDEAQGGGATHEGLDFLTLAERAQTALSAGKFDEAREAFLGIHDVLTEGQNYQRAVALERAGFCLLMEGRPLDAAVLLQKSTGIADGLEPSEGVRALQGVIQSELGQVFSSTGYVGQAKEAFEAAIEIARGLGDKRALAIDLDHLGILELRQGRSDVARAHFEEALAHFNALSLVGAQAVVLHHLGLVAESVAEWDGAEQNFAKAAEILVEAEDYESAGRLFTMAADACVKAGRAAAAEDWYCKALEHARLGINPLDLRRTLASYARLLQSRPDALKDARELIEEALAAGEKSLEPDIWELYGQLADVIALQADHAGEQSGAAQGLRASAHNYRHIHRYGPRLLATLKEIGEAPSFGAAVILERIGQCCLMGGRPAPAVILFQQAISALDVLSADGEAAKGLRGVLLSEMGDAYRLAGFPEDARKNYQAALEVARTLGDLRGELVQLTHLGAFALASGEAEAGLAHLSTAKRIARNIGQKDIHRALAQQIAAASPEGREGNSNADPETHDARSDAPFSIELQRDVVTECAFGSDLLIEVRHETSFTPVDGAQYDPLPEDVRPIMAPLVRVALDERGAMRIYVPVREPEVLQEQDCVVMRKLSSEIVITGHLEPVWALVRLADGSRRVADLMAEIDSSGSDIRHLMATLAALGALDVSGRTVAKFMHTATKKGVMAGGGLAGEGVIRLVTDGTYRTFPEAVRTPLTAAVPEDIAAFHALTRVRRSRRDYNGEALPRTAFDVLLHTACGVTGATAWSDRNVNLRAYPSSGALYAVEIYPVVFGVEGLEPGIYHYVAADNALEAVRIEADLSSVIEACLPVEREMVSGAGAMICLVGEFRRHETKYGEGGYRMMVAEAGHISQNLVLSAAALGLSARPFGGVFDALINRQLGLDEAEEQFLLSVLVGKTTADAAQHSQPSTE